MLKVTDSVLKIVIKELDRIIRENKKQFKDKGVFLVRPGYSYNKFYLDKTEGSYDSSLQGLIHHIMYKKGCYKTFLTVSEYADLKNVIKDYPESIYAPDNDSKNYEKVQFKILDVVYQKCLAHVEKSLLKFKKHEVIPALNSRTPRKLLSQQKIRRKESKNEIMVVEVGSNPKLSVNVSIDFIKEIEFVKKLVKSSSAVVKLFPAEILSNKEFISTLVLTNASVLAFVNDKFKDDYDIVILAVTNDNNSLKYASVNLRGNSKLFEYCLRNRTSKDCSFIQYASDKLRNDPKLMLKIITEDGQAVKYLGERLSNDKTFILQLFKKELISKEFIPKKFLSDDTFLLNCLKIDGTLLENLGVKQKANKDYVMTAIKQNGDAIEFAADKFKNEKELVMLALKQSPTCAKFIPKKVLNDKQIALIIAKGYHGGEKYIPSALRKDPDIIKAIKRLNEMAEEYLL
jgi:hypothetical protein